MENLLNKLSWIVLIVFAVGLGIILLCTQAQATGGWGCPGKDHTTYRCNCPSGGRYSEYYSDEDLTAARKNPNSCCYTGLKAVKEPVIVPITVTDWVELTRQDYKTATWELINGTWIESNGVGENNLLEGSTWDFLANFLFPSSL